MNLLKLISLFFDMLVLYLEHRTGEKRAELRMKMLRRVNESLSQFSNAVAEENEEKVSQELNNLLSKQ